VQLGFEPFVAALIVSELFLRMRLSGLAIIAGFSVMLYLVSDFSFGPLTPEHKIVLLGFLSTLLSLLFMLFNPGWLRFLLTLAGGGAAIWTMLSILKQYELLALPLWAGGCAIYLGWLVFWFDGLHESSARAGTAGMALGLGSGVSALLCATALPEKFGFAVGAAASAYLLIQIITNSPLPCGRIFTLPLSIIAGLSGCLAILTTKLPWYSLPVLALIPVAAQIPLSGVRSLRLQSVLLSVISLALAGSAVYLTWRVVGGSLF
jgi:hypothetical protein